MKSPFHLHAIMPVILITILFFSLFTPQVVSAEGEIPEIPVPPVDDIQTNLPTSNDDPLRAAVLLSENSAELVTEGEGKPLTSQYAISGLCNSDPWYLGAACPGGKCLYTTTDYGVNALRVALENWSSNKGYGYIFIESYSSPYALNHYQIDAATGYASLKGLKWDEAGINKPRIQGSLEITNFTSGFEINGLYIHTDASYPILSFTNNKGLVKLSNIEISDSFRSGIVINNHAGSVTINQVYVHDNKYNGVEINNCGSGVSCLNTGSIQLTNSTIYHNGTNGVNYSGLKIMTAGTVTVNGVTIANNYGKAGIEIQTKNSLTIKNSAIVNTLLGGLPQISNGIGVNLLSGSTGNVLFENVLIKNNEGSGAWIETTGNITLKKVQGLDNGYYGVNIGNADLITKIAGGKTITISDSIFSTNSNMNLLILASGAVTLSNINAQYSVNKYGAHVDNSLALTPQPVMITNSQFNYNKERGLSIFSKGEIKLNGIQIHDNTGTNEALYVSNNVAGVLSGITFLSTLGSNQVFNNADAKLAISLYTNGALLMNNLQVFYNGGDGLIAEQVGGAITWNGGGAWNNGQRLMLNYGIGAKLVNSSAVLPKTVILRDVDFSRNQTGTLTTSFDKGIGLYISSKGTVTVTNITADYNARGGVIIDAMSGAGNVNILRTQLSGYNSFSNNKGTGIRIDSIGKIVLNRIQAIDNKGAGALLNAYGIITITGTASQPNLFNGNEGYDNSLYGSLAGLQIGHVNGPVKITNLQANGNLGSGVYIYANGPVILDGQRNELNLNSEEGISIEQQYGLYIDRSNGSVLILNFVVESNHGGGVYIRNLEGSVGVTLNSTIAGFTSQITNGQGDFSNRYGLYIESSGAILLNRLNISENSNPATSIINTGASISKPVTVTNSSFNQNNGMGLNIISAGAIVLNKVTASGNTNGASGASLYNDTIIPGQVYNPITIINSSFNDNNGAGVDSQTRKALTITSVTASGNGEYGLFLKNDSGVGSPVLVNGSNHFIANASEGIYIRSTGVVTASGIEAGSNDSDGIYIETVKQVTLSNSWVYNNATGISIVSAPVNILNLTSMANATSGLYIEYVPAGGKVILTNSSFIYNPNSYGFEIHFDSGLPTDFVMSNVNYFGNNFGGDANYLVSY